MRSKVVVRSWRTECADDLRPGGGARVCLLLPLGEALVVALVAALRLGLAVTLLPPAGPRWVAPRLAAARAAVVTTRDYASLAGAGAILLGEPRPPAPPRRASFTYAPGAVAARLFSA